MKYHPFKREVRQYEMYFWFDGGKGDEDIRVHKQKIVKIRKPHECSGLRQELYQHPIEVGTYALRETAIIDGQWSQCYLCIDCMDAWFDEIGY